MASILWVKVPYQRVAQHMETGKLHGQQGPRRCIVAVTVAFAITKVEKIAFSSQPACFYKSVVKEIIHRAAHSIYFGVSSEIVPTDLDPVSSFISLP